MAARSLQSQLLTFVIGSLLVLTLSFGLTVWISTTNHVRSQIQSNLSVAEGVLKQLLQYREDQLFSSAEVLTSDFGFKQAVATEDAATIESVLLNHGNRIGADLMGLLSLKGDFIASNMANKTLNINAAPLISRTLKEGGSTHYLSLNEKLYQVILLPVKAPIPVAVAMIGFEMDQQLANRLKDLTLLDVTFLANNSQSTSLVSTLNADALESALSNAVGSQGSLDFPLIGRSQFSTVFFSLSNQNTQQVTVYLTVATSAAFQNFDRLQLEITAISLAISVLALIGSVIVARHLTTPLKNLAESTSRLANGEYRKHSVPVSQVKEIGELANAFDKMQIDLSEREARIFYHAHHDPLTQLINRQHSVTLLQESLQQSTHKQLTAFSINILDFKIVNDTFGHYVGDRCLHQIGDRLLSINKEDCLAARLGGDEFLVVVSTMNNRKKTAEELLTLLSKPYAVNDLDITLNFSMGVASIPEDGSSADELIQKASIALDMARREHINIAYYTQRFEEEHLKRLRLLADLKQTLTDDNGQLRMYFQPKVSAQSLDASRFEALIRWIHPEQGFIPPDLFIPLAEQAGLITAVTDWVLNAVVRQISEWNKLDFNVQVAVNLSAKDLSRSSILATIQELLARFEVSSSQISFEITESEIMRDPKEAIALLSRFRDSGFDLAIDDFGTGYSSLSQLKNMPVTELKIDKSFILHLANTDDDKIIVRSTIDLAHSFNLKVVAEGIENQESLALLQSWGCDWIQGFHISKPIPAPDVFHWVNQHKIKTNSDNLARKHIQL